MTTVGFIGLGNVGAKLAGSLARNGVQLTVRDLDPAAAQPFLEQGAPLEVSPKLIEIFEDGQQRYGAREWSSNIIRRLEDACNVQVLAPGFPAQMADHEHEQRGREVVVAAVRDAACVK